MGSDQKTVPVLLLDVVGFTSRYRRREAKRAVLERLQQLLDATAAGFLTLAKDPWQVWRRHDTGDGYYVMFTGHPPAVAAEYARCLGEALEGDSPHPDMALRMVLDLGDVETVGDQYLADAFCDAARLIDDGQFRAHLAARSKPWALAVSQFFHDELGRDPRRSLFPDLVALDGQWSPITVVDKHGERHSGFVLGPGWESAPEEDPPPAAASSRPAESEADWRPYLEALVRQTRHVDMKGIANPGKAEEARQVRIEEIYTPLRSRRLGERLEGRGLGSPGEGDLVPLSELLPEHRRLLIVGQPGAGKTTFAWLVACLLARDWLGEPHPSGGSWRGRHLGLVGPVELPVLLRVTDLVTVMSEPGAPALRYDTRQWILDTLARLSTDNVWSTVMRRHWEGLLEERGALLLLDGLDEVADEELRARLFGMFEDACAHWGCRMVVTSRPLATERLVELGFHPVEIEPFGEREIRVFLERWVSALYEVGSVGELDAEQKRYHQSLLEAIVRVPGVRRLASNPVMMTCLCVVHWYEGRLPEGRSRVYKSVIRWLLHSRRKQRAAAGFSDGFSHKALARLALWMVAYPDGKRTEVSVEEGVEALESVTQRHFRDLDGEDRRREARRWLREECLWSGILEERPGHRVGFWHLTFGEYLAAQQLAWRGDRGGDQEGDWWPLVLEHLEDVQWREVLELLPVCLYDEGGENRVDTLLERVLALRKEGDPVSEARVAGIVGRIRKPLSLPEVSYAPRPDLAESCSQLLRRTLSLFTVKGASGVPVAVRIEASEALGQSGDPRLASPSANWVEVPGASVRLGKYLVTVEEYGRFVSDGGYEERRHWSAVGWRVREEEGWTCPGRWEKQEETANRPVVYVSWWEAEAYCGWLSRQLGTEVRLPREAEWLSVASPDGRTYPWGEEEPDRERANFAKKYGEPHVGRPTPVGIYPSGDGAFGHSDLAGNVWEWSADAWDDQQAADDPDKEMVLRGGSWIYPARLLGAADRDWHRARDRGGNVGFRVCVAASNIEP